jgi:hypothetical protein
MEQQFPSVRVVFHSALAMGKIVSRTGDANSILGASRYIFDPKNLQALLRFSYIF